MNFNEFKLNSPSTINYEFKPGKLGDILYIKKDGLEYPERNAWGYCDGEKTYVYSADKFFELFRTDNTFYFKGMKSLTKKVNDMIGNASILNYDD
jgi:hypothetical protein